MTCGFHLAGQCSNGDGTFFLGEWRATNLAASQTNVLFNRATGNSTGVQIPQNCTLIGWGCYMDNLGLSNPVAGAAMTIKAIRVTVAGAAQTAVTIGTVDIGETNVVKVASTPIDFSAAEIVYPNFTTPAGWSNLTCDPEVYLIFRPR